MENFFFKFSQVKYTFLNSKKKKCFSQIDFELYMRETKRNLKEADSLRKLEKLKE